MRLYEKHREMNESWSLIIADATQAAGLARFERAWPNYTPELLNERLRIIKLNP